MTESIKILKILKTIKLNDSKGNNKNFTSRCIESIPENHQEIIELVFIYEVQRIPGQGGYLKKLTSFHSDISLKTFFNSILIYFSVFLYHFTSILLKFNSKNEPRFDVRSTLKNRHF